MKSKRKKKYSIFLSIIIVFFLLLAAVLAVWYSQKQQHVNQYAATSASPSGEDMPVGDLPGWHQIFTDDFTTNVTVPNFFSVYGNRWRSYGDGVSDTSGNGRRYDTQVLSVTNGILNIYIHTALVNGTYVHMVGSPVQVLSPWDPNCKTVNGTGCWPGQLYGRYSIRMRADLLSNYKTAFLLWPQSQNWSYDGEIDFPESLHDLTGPINAAVWWEYGNYADDDQNWWTVTGSGFYNNWHTYTIDWTPNAIVYYIDGDVVENFSGSIATWSDGRSKIPNTPMYWVLQTETQLTPIVNPANNIAGNVQVDWAAAYSYSPPTTGTPVTPTPSVKPTPSTKPSAIPTPTYTPTPTPKPTSSPTPSVMPSATPTPTPLPGTTTLSFPSILLHGIGSAGDSVAPGTSGNTSPLTPNRTLSVQVVNASNVLVTTLSGTITYSPSSGGFSGSVSLGSTVPTGSYLVKVKTDKYLVKQLPGIITLTQGQTTTIPPVSLIVGDINNDNTLNILDYNILLGCYSDFLPPTSCPGTNGKESDLNDDGSVNASDYNLFLRELSVQSGQ